MSAKPTDIEKVLSDLGEESQKGTLGDYWELHWDSWKSQFKKPDMEKIIAKKNILKAGYSDLGPEELGKLELAFEVDGEKGLRDEGAKLIEANKSLKDAINANVDMIITRGRL